MSPRFSAQAPEVSPRRHCQATALRTKKDSANGLVRFLEEDENLLGLRFSRSLGSFVGVQVLRNYRVRSTFRDRLLLRPQGVNWQGRMWRLLETAALRRLTPWQSAARTQPSAARARPRQPALPCYTARWVLTFGRRCLDGISDTLGAARQHNEASCPVESRGTCCPPSTGWRTARYGHRPRR